MWTLRSVVVRVHSGASKLPETGGFCGLRRARRGSGLVFELLPSSSAAFRHKTNVPRVLLTLLGASSSASSLSIHRSIASALAGPVMFCSRNGCARRVGRVQSNHPPPVAPTTTDRIPFSAQPQGQAQRQLSESWRDSQVRTANLRPASAKVEGARRFLTTLRQVPCRARTAHCDRRPRPSAA